MTETTKTCIRGCTRFGLHMLDCEERDTEGGCRGCLPRQVHRGDLCGTCYRRLELMLTDVPTAIRWLTGNMSGIKANRARGDADQIRSAEDGQPAPIKVAVMDCRDLLADQMASWVDLLCEEQNLTGPRHSPEADAQFMLVWLSTVAALPWVGDFIEELAQTMVEAHALAPWRPEKTRIPGIPCPHCERVTLVIYGGEEDVTCQTCKVLIRPERYALWVRVINEEKRASA